jgi:hypothetical protein
MTDHHETVEKASHDHIDDRDDPTVIKNEPVVISTEFDPKDVRKLLLKLDTTILPFAVLLYLSAYLDRGNL